MQPASKVAGVFFCLVFSVPAISQAPKSDPDLAAAVRELQAEVRELRSAVLELRTESVRYRQEAIRLRQQNFRKRFAPAQYKLTSCASGSFT